MREPDSSNPNLADEAQRAAARDPLGTALVSDQSHLTHRDLADRVGRLASGLAGLGLRRGDRVVLLMENRVELVETLLAAMHAGMAAVPVNRHLHPREVEYIVDDCDAAAVVLAAECDSVGQRLRDRSKPAPILVGVAGAMSADHAYETILRTAEPSPVAEVDGDAPAWLFYTSGTTGHPKGAVLTHRNLRAMVTAFHADIDSIDSSAVFLHAAPLTHGSGLYYLPALFAGAPNVLAPPGSFDGAEYLRLIADHRVTHGAFLSPTMLNRVVRAAADTDCDLGTLRIIVCGGAPIYVADLELARKALGPVVVQLYGQGESPMTITATSSADLDGLDNAGVRRRLASCGKARSGVEIKVVVDGVQVAPQVPGEVIVRGEVVMGGYWNNPAATATALRDGWLYTGDVGYLDEDGYLYLIDRSKDLIITGGSNVYPREVEEVLLTHPAVRESAVFGVPDSEWGESVAAAVVVEADVAVTAAELIDHCRAHLAGFKKPRHVAFVEALPKNPTGKVLRRDLPALLHAK